MSKSYKSGTGIGIIAFVVLILFGIITYNKVGLENQYSINKNRISDLQVQIDNQKDRKKEIKEYKAYVQTPRYIKDIARDKLGLVEKDDVIFTPEKDQDD